MNNWNFEIAAAPKGEWVESVEKGGGGGERTVRRYRAPKVILASKCGKVITTSWLPPDEAEKGSAGRWNGFMPGEEIVAWQMYPTHPMEEDNSDA